MMSILAYLVFITIVILLSIIGNKFISKINKLTDISQTLEKKLENIQESQLYIWNNLQVLKEQITQKNCYKNTSNDPDNTRETRKNKNNDPDNTGETRKNKNFEFQQKSVLVGHTKPINSFAIQNSLLASASDDCTVRLWNLDAEKQVYSFFESQEVRDITINHLHQTIAAGGFDNTIISWKLDSKALDRIFSRHDNVVYAVTYSKDGKVLISGSADKTIKIWDAATGKLKSILKGHKDAILSLAISPCNKYLVSGSKDRTIKIWDLKRPQNQPKTLGDHSGWVTSVAITSNGEKLVTTSKDKTVKMWCLKTKKLIHIISAHLDEIWSITISPDDRIFAVASLNNIAKLYELKTGQHLQTLNACSPVIFSKNGKYLITGGSRNQIKIWQKEVS